MRRFVISCLRVILDIGFWLTVLSSGVGGYLAGVRSPGAAALLGDSTFAGGILGSVIGLVGGFLLACILFGVFYLIFQIEENTRRGSEFFEVLGRRMRTREQAETEE